MCGGKGAEKQGAELPGVDQWVVAVKQTPRKKRYFWTSCHNK